MAAGNAQVCPICGKRFSAGEIHCPFDGARLDGSIAVSRADPLIGTVIGGRHSIVERVGVGGMGVVYRGIQHGLERPVALKVLSSRFNDDERAAERFRTEARAASLLANPHSVKVYDFGTTNDGSLYLAMQFVEGEPLAKRIARGRLSLYGAIDVAAQVCASLAEAHERTPAIIHRDIKPDNIMIRDTTEGKHFAVVLDFGLARFADTQRLTMTNTVIGTPAYMSPEQARGNGVVDFHSDLYAVGIVLFEMVTGQRPFSSPDSAGLLFKHAFDAPPLLKDVYPDLDAPDDLQKLVSQLLAKSAADRPSSAASVRTRLLDMRTAVGATRNGKVSKAMPEVAKPPMQAAPTETAKASLPDSDKTEDAGVPPGESPTRILTANAPDQMPPHVVEPATTVSVPPTALQKKTLEYDLPATRRLRAKWPVIAGACAAFAGLAIFLAYPATPKPVPTTPPEQRAELAKIDPPAEAHANPEPAAPIPAAPAIIESPRPMPPIQHHQPPGIAKKPAPPKPTKLTREQERELMLVP